MAKKRLQKKREAAKASAFQAAAAKAETPKITTKKVQPIKVETTKTEPVKVETKKTEPISSTVVSLIKYPNILFPHFAFIILTIYYYKYRNHQIVLIELL